MTELAADTFTRSDAANLGASWTQQFSSSAITVSGNEATVTQAVQCAEYYNATAAPDDGYAEIIVGTNVETLSDTGVGPAYRMSVSASSANKYLAQGNAVETRLYKEVSGSFTQLGSDGPAVSTGDKLRIKCSGTTISVELNDTEIITATDSDITSGRAGMWGFRGSVNSQAASFAFGNLSAGVATLSAPAPSGTLATQTTATIGATTDQTTGTFYCVVDSAANISGITAAQIKLGNNNADAAAVASANAAVSTTSPSAGVTGLTANTLYSYAAVQNNANGDSNVVTGTFTTAAAGGGGTVTRGRQSLLGIGM